MVAQSASTRGTSRPLIGLVLWGLAGGCATYENTVPDANGVVGSAGAETGASGSGGSSMAGSSTGGAPAVSGSAPTAGMAGNGGGTGGVAGSSAGAAGKPSGGSAGAGGASQAGSGGVAGAGGKGGSGGSGGSGGKGSGGSSGSSGSGGNGGAGGSAPLQTCAKNPISMKSKWVVTASSSSNADPTTNAHDGVLTNRWATGKDQIGNEWLQLDFGVTVTVTKVTLVLGSASSNDYPRSYAARFSNTSNNQTAPVLVSGMGAASTDTVLNFSKGTTGRYLLVTQSGKATALWWSVAEIQAECTD